MSGRRALPALLALALTARAAAHPMGNFSVGQYAALTPGRDGVSLSYVLDLAEMPTYNLRAELGVGAAAPLSPELLEQYRERTSAKWLAGLTLKAGTTALALAPTGGRAVLAPGAGGLPTVRFEIAARAPWPAGLGTGEHRLEYRDGNFSDRVGWKEVVARAGDGVTIVRASVPSEDRSAALTKYPEETAAAPSAVLAAELAIALAAPGAAARASGSPAAPAAGSHSPPSSPPASFPAPPDPLSSAGFAIALAAAALAVVGVAAALSAAPSTRARAGPSDGAPRP